MKYRVGHGGGKAHEADFAEALGPDGVEDGIGLVEENDVDVGHIGAGGNVLLGEVVVYETAVAVVEHGVFH